MEVIKNSMVLSSGMARGKAFLFVPKAEELNIFYEIEEHEIQQELHILECATASLLKELSELEKRVEEEIGRELSEVFKAHQMMLSDKAIQDEIVKEIREEFVSAGEAVKVVFRRWIHRFAALESEISQQKKDDLHDLKERLLLYVGGNEKHPLSALPEDCIIVGKNLTPSDTIYLSEQTVSAVIIEEGGIASHASLFCREMSLPCIGQVKDALQRIQNDDYLLVDTYSNSIVIEPDEQHILRFEEDRRKVLSDFDVIREHASEQAISSDGTPISVGANIGSVTDAEKAAEYGADSIGLLRLEKLYIGRENPPLKEELREELSTIFELVKDKEITVRLLDAGADKSFSYLDLAKEANPALGCRGVRLLLRFPALLQTQLETLIELSHTYRLRVLIPMISVAEDVFAIKEAIDECAQRIHLKPQFKIGAMIETPAAVLLLSSFIGNVDFVSLGTNDLTQYTFAADRENARIVQYFTDDSEAIFSLITMVCSGAGNVPVSVCGELAGNVEATARLLQCGVRKLSVPPSLVPFVKESVRKVSL